MNPLSNLTFNNSSKVRPMQLTDRVMLLVSYNAKNGIYQEACVYVRACVRGFVRARAGSCVRVCERQRKGHRREKARE